MSKKSSKCVWSDYYKAGFILKFTVELYLCSYFLNPYQANTGAPVRELETNLSPEQKLARTVEDMDAETIASLAQNITDSLWWDKFQPSGDRFGGLMSGNGLGLLQGINSQQSGQGNVFMRENCGRYPTFDGSCNHPSNGGK